jgi:hypothetical protein
MSNLKDYRVPAGDRFLQVLVVGCALFEFKREPRRMVPYYSPDAQLKLVGEVEPRIVANRRTLMGHLQDSERCEVLASKWNKVWQRVFFLLQGLMDRRVVCNAPSWSMADLPCSFCRSAMIEAQ